MLIEIQDDFDLEKIALSGQCFRVKQFTDGVYRFITGDNIIYIQKTKNKQFSISCSKDQWDKIWRIYFDLDRCYSDIFCSECEKHPFVHQAMVYGRGIRILRQDAWEMLITFIISQRKNIPAIAKSVENLALRYGRLLQTAYETLHLFPSPQDMKDSLTEELMECGLGYRTKYVLDAVRQVISGVLDLEAISKCGDDELIEKLQSVYGVGKKVANCVSLFAYGRTACVPIDVWISRAIENECKGESPFSLFGENAGIIQQYVFYYEKYHQYNPR